MTGPTAVRHLLPPGRWSSVLPGDPAAAPPMPGPSLQQPYALLSNTPPYSTNTYSGQTSRPARHGKTSPSSAVRMQSRISVPTV